MNHLIQLFLVTLHFLEAILNDKIIHYRKIILVQLLLLFFVAIYFTKAFEHFKQYFEFLIVVRLMFCLKYQHLFSNFVRQTLYRQASCFAILKKQDLYFTGLFKLALTITSKLVILQLIFIQSMLCQHFVYLLQLYSLVNLFFLEDLMLQGFLQQKFNSCSHPFI